VEGDGDADLFVGTFTSGDPATYRVRGATEAMPNRLLLNDGAGRFTVSARSGVALSGVTSGAVFADLDDDGDDDLVVSEYTRPASAPRLTSPRAYELNHLYRNDKGTFTDVTTESGIRPSGFLSGRSIGVLDFNADGCLDLYLVADGLVGNTGTSRLLKGDCRLHFADVTTAAGLASAQGEVVQGLGVAIADVDIDGRPDIFVAGGPKKNPRRNYLSRNRGDGTLTVVSNGTMFLDPPAVAGATEDWTSAASFADVNRDGRLDLAVSHHFGSGADGTPIKPQLYLNRTPWGGAVTFQNVTAATTIAGIAAKTPHVELADIDNDGWPDLYLSVLLGARRQLAVYRHTGTFTPAGAPIFTSPSDRSSPDYYVGGPLVDVDRDGRLEPFLDEYEPSKVPPLLHNDSTGTGAWLDVVVKGTRNTDGIGSTVRVFAAFGPARVLVGAMPIQTGSGYSSASLPVAHFGLGGFTTVDVEVTPPGGGATRVLRGVSVDQRVRVNL
jgi:hypothetical protein